ncbi:TetR/AcrR family transcriptional regulator [Actinomadura viridis]
MQAALDLIGGEGWQAATVRGVSSRAGLNDRYFYESFTDLDELLLAVVDDQAGQGAQTILTAARNAPRHLRTRTQITITAILDFLTSDPRRIRLMAVEFPASALLQQRKREIIRFLAGIFTGQVHEVLDEVPLSSEDLDLTALTITAGLWETITLWLRGDLSTSRQHLTDYIVALLLATTALPAALDNELS